MRKRSDIKVSVVMPVYNSQDYLEQALCSLLNQSLSDIEIICVDDGSDDGSLKILNRFGGKDDRVTVIAKNHSNAGDARNAGMKEANGKYLLFLDSDDFFSPEMIEIVYNEAEEKEADIIVFGGNNYSEKTKKTEINSGLLQMNLVPGEEVFNLKEHRGRISFSSSAPWNKLFLKEFIKENELQFQSVQSANDLFFVTMAMLLADRITVIDRQLISYRTDNPKSLQGSEEKSPYDGLSALRYLYDELKRRKIFDRCRMDFNERCMAICLYLLGRISIAQTYEDFYRFLRNDFLKYVEMREAERMDFYNPSLYYELEDIVLEELPTGYLLKKIKKYNLTKTNNWLFPFSSVPKSSTIILYGAGRVGKCFYQQIIQSGYCEIAEWVDSKETYAYGIKVIRPQIASWSADNVVIAVEKKETALQLKRELINRGIEGKRIIWKVEVLFT